MVGNNGLSGVGNTGTERPAGQSLASSRRLFLLAALAGCIIAIVSIWQVFAGNSEYRGHYKGDIFSELNAYTAGLNFATHGFANLYFLSAIYRYYEAGDPRAAEHLYTHYPPAAEIISGVLQTLGVHDFYCQKACLLLLDGVALVLLAVAVRRILPEHAAVAPLVFVALAASSVWFVWWAGNLHKSTYETLFMACGLWSVASRRERWFLGVCFCAPFFSFEVVPWLTVLGAFAAARNMAEKTWRGRTALLFVSAMAGMFCLSVGIHLLQNACYFHSLRGAVDDLLKAFLYRTGVTPGTDLGATDKYSIAKHAAKIFYACWWFYGLGILVLAVVGLKRSLQKRWWLPVVLLAAGVVWPLVFRQHSMVHGFTMRHAGIGLLVLATIGFLTWWQQTTAKKLMAAMLLAAAMCRLPAGCEISANPFCLRMLHRVVAQTDTATIEEVLWFFKDSPEHRAEKAMLINELARRCNVPKNQPAYSIVLHRTPVSFIRDQQGFSVGFRLLPKDRTPAFHDDVLAYQSERYQTRSPSKVDEPTVLPPLRVVTIEPPAAGNCNKLRYRLLVAYLLLL